MTGIVIISGPRPAVREADAREEAVVLLHGLGRGTGSMMMLARRLSQQGFYTYRIGYPSRRLAIATAVERVHAAMHAILTRHAVTHLVGHSLGGIIARRIALLCDETNTPLGRVVQIGAPNRGAAAGIRLMRALPMAWCLGPAGTELSAPLPRPERRSDVAAIAGIGRPRFPGILFGLPGPGDGTVGLRSAWAGAGARTAIDCAHTLLPLSRRVAALTGTFLAHGSFGPAEAAERRRCLA